LKRAPVRAVGRHQRDCGRSLRASAPRARIVNSAPEALAPRRAHPAGQQAHGRVGGMLKDVDIVVAVRDVHEGARASGAHLPNR
jgi:hypothetical protein